MGACFGGDENESNNAQSASKISKSQLSIAILTWNIGTSKPSDSMDVLFVHKDFNADIYVVGLEEVVELNAINAIIDDDKNDNLWKKKVNTILNQDKSDENDRYSLLKEIDMVGILALVFCKNSIKNDINNVSAEKTATGMFTVVGNKGGVGIRFNLYNTSMCFICCHLEAHKDEVDERNEDYHEILKELQFEVDDEKEKTILSHDVVFMFGDLNYRLNFDDDQLQNVYALITERKWGELLERDQLIDAMRNNKAFDGFTEESIDFQPTYKFEPGTNEYEQKKKRMPSYCDRILWRDARNNKALQCVKYDMYLDHDISDHKPVVGLYQLEI